MAGIAVFGITGRMGQSLVRALREVPEELTLSGAIASSASARLGLEAALEGAATGVLITADAGQGLACAAVAVDFSVAHCVADHARACLAAGVPLLVGSTGFDAAVSAALQAAALKVAVLIAPNTSVGVTVMARLAALASAALGSDYDVEIAEAHHRLKRDAPSGTALALGEVIARSRGAQLAKIGVFERHGPQSLREPGSIGFSVLRAGDIVGEHTVSFATAGERLEITHRATDRMTFARGALRAARWLVGRAPGLYGMENVLGL